MIVLSSRSGRQDMIRTSRDFGRLIRERRLAQGMTQRELALACGTGERFIVELEAGKPSCRLDKALHVAGLLGIALDDRPARPQTAGGTDVLDLPDFKL